MVNTVQVKKLTCNKAETAHSTVIVLVYNGEGLRADIREDEQGNGFSNSAPNLTVYYLFFG